MYEHIELVNELLYLQGSSSPSSLCLIFEGKDFSYGEVFKDSIRIKDFLIRAGLEKGDRVLFNLINSPEYVSTFFGILMAGGIAVPLNVALPPKSVFEIAEDSESSFLITFARFFREASNFIEGAGFRAVLVHGAEEGGIDPDKFKGLKFSTFDEVRRMEAEDLPASDVSRDDLAMLIYTSGTTGRPRGVMLSHRNLIANTRSILSYLPISKDDRGLAILPFSYSYGNSILLTHIAAGASLVIENRFAYPDVVVHSMERFGVTGLSGVPSTFAILCKRSSFLKRSLPQLRYITVAGGAMPPALTRTIIERFPHIEIHLMYGQTEATARLSSLPPDKVASKPYSIGRGIPGVQLRVVHEDGRDILPGEVGEIIAKGENLMLGYWKNNEGTRQVLKGGYLWTGDMATVDEDGDIRIVSRRSDMIKSGAHRIGPEEIERVLMEVDGVEECAVIGLPDELLGESVKAFVVPRDGSNISAKFLLDHCKRSLAPFKVPRAIEFIRSLPKTPSGKIQRGELRAMEKKRLFDEGSDS